MKLLLIAVSASVLACCTAESTLDTLKEDFPRYRPDLNELKDLMLVLGKSENNFRYFSSRATGGADDFIDFFNLNQPRLPVSEPLENNFPKYRVELLRVQAIVHKLDLDYVSVDRENGAVWITLEGGGVLGSDRGYLYYPGSERITNYSPEYLAPISGTRDWYAFIG